jgi:hypothetical protein
MSGGRFAPMASAEPRPSRARALTGTGAGAGQLAPLRWVCGCSPLRGPRHRAGSISAGSPSNGADDSFTHWHLSGWTGQSCRRKAERFCIGSTRVGKSERSRTGRGRPRVR